LERAITSHAKLATSWKTVLATVNTRRLPHDFRQDVEKGLVFCFVTRKVSSLTLFAPALEQQAMHQSLLPVEWHIRLQIILICKALLPHLVEVNLST
jgi:hypothetical protein